MELAPLSDQVVAVGDQLSLVLVATSNAGDIQYGFSANVPGIKDHATLARRADGSAAFSWRPLAADVGTWAFDFTATSSAGTDTLTIQVEVRSAVGSSTAPIFRTPLGTGTMLDLSKNTCVDLDVMVQDTDSTSVTIAQEPPIVEGAELTREGDFTATWHWCPSAAQIASDGRYTMRLSADDGSNPKTMKTYVIVLRKALGTDCPGQPPTVSSTPVDESLVVGLTVVAEVADDKGFKEAPLFYYATTQPASPPNLADMTQLDMLLLDGSPTNGSWAADVPNPVASAEAGATATIWYVVVATDNDDEMGDCDHLTQSEVYRMTVTNPGGSGGLGACDACTADIQCGSGGGDLCVRVGTEGESYCLTECAGDGDCASGYSCSGSMVSSVEGIEARQCVPDAGTCGTEWSGSCTDDSMEDNDVWTDAVTLLAGTQTGLVSCDVGGVAGDDDWYQLDVDHDGTLTVSIMGTFDSDLDLALLDQDGFAVTASTGPTAEEGITQPVSSGTYFVRVKAYPILGSGGVIDRNEYSLTWSVSEAGSCVDDGNEPDDSSTGARPASIWPDPFVAETNAICSGDDDWYRIELYSSETAVVDLTFNQTAPTENLDLHFFDDSLTDQTPCSEASPSTCSSFQGQSIDSDEHYEFTAPASGCPCDYYVVVRGWAGSENVYDIRIALAE